MKIDQLLNLPWWVKSIVAGVLLGLSFPPFPFPFLIIPAFLIFLHLADHARSISHTLYLVYPGMVIWNIIATYWLMMATVAGGVAAILANAVIMTLPLGIFHFCRKKFSTLLPAILIFPASWVSYELLHHRWDLAWPWLVLGNAFSSFPPIIQFISFTGVLGLSLWILVITSLLYLFLKQREKKIGLALISVFVFPIVISVFQTAFYTSPENQSTLNVAILQPNYDSYQSNSGFNSEEEAIDDLIAFASKHAKGSDLIVWPENGFEGSSYPHSFLHRRLKDSARVWDAALIGGLTLIDTYPADKTPKVFRFSRGGNPYDFFNAAGYWSPRGEHTFYKKHNLVPIVERLPFSAFLKTIDAGDWVNWQEIIGYGKGDDMVFMPAGSDSTYALICYDSVFPNWNRRHVKNGAGITTIITNDGWWGKTSGHIQHFEFARLRAIETRRTVIRSANNGISGIINPLGEVTAITGYWERDAIKATVSLSEEITFYTRYGDWIGWFSFIFALLGFGFAAIRGFKK